MKITIFRFVDSHDNNCEVCYQNPNDTVCVTGLQEPDGTHTHFESEAYHVYDWADANGITIFRYELDINLAMHNAKWNSTIIHPATFYVRCGVCGNVMENGRCRYEC